MLRRIKKNTFVLLAVFLAVFLFSGCSDSPTKTTPSVYDSSETYAPTKTIKESPPIRQLSPVENIEPSDYGPQTFNGDECISDCSGHEAGYDWAEEKGITDPSDCGGNSNSFIEGCESYAEEQ